MTPIINLDAVALELDQHGDRFASRDGSIAAAIGARQLGAALCVVPPGKRACPFHNHHVNEELFVILDGHGVVRIGAAEHPIRAGDVIAAPAGGRDTAHQIINTSDAELRYLAISTKTPHEIVEYPDSGKVLVRSAVVAGAPPTFQYLGDLDRPRDYWDGE